MQRPAGFLGQRAGRRRAGTRAIRSARKSLRATQTAHAAARCCCRCCCTQQRAVARSRVRLLCVGPNEGRGRYSCTVDSWCPLGPLRKRRHLAIKRLRGYKRCTCGLLRGHCRGAQRAAVRELRAPSPKMHAPATNSTTRAAPQRAAPQPPQRAGSAIRAGSATRAALAALRSSRTAQRCSGADARGDARGSRADARAGARGNAAVAQLLRHCAFVWAAHTNLRAFEAAGHHDAGVCARSHHARRDQ
jgi:hypothetical protein